MIVRTMEASDWEDVSRIYLEGIATGLATFEIQAHTYQYWDKAHSEECRLVAENDDEIMGWAALSPVSSRCVYGGVGEVSVYVSNKSRGKGVGQLLMTHLIKENEKAGFRYIGKRERIGKLHGVWKDNLLFERRSSTVGAN